MLSHLSRTGGMLRATAFPFVTGYVVAGVAELVFRRCKH